MQYPGGQKLKKLIRLSLSFAPSRTHSREEDITVLHRSVEGKKTQFHLCVPRRRRFVKACLQKEQQKGKKAMQCLKKNSNMQMMA